MEARRLVVAALAALLAVASGSTPDRAATPASPLQQGKLFCPPGTHPVCTTPTTCKCVADELVQLTGNVVGLSGKGLTLINEGFSIGVSTNGPVTILAKANEVYGVDINSDPTGPLQACYVLNGTGTATASGNSQPFTVMCSKPYTVGGTITGLISGSSAPYLTLSLESPSIAGSPDTEKQNGPFTFAMPLANGRPYQVILNSNPNLENCNIANGSGTIAGSNVTNILVSCTLIDNVMLQGMEVTQAIQDMNNSVTLIAGKPTWVRVYLDKNTGTRAVTAKLQATRGGSSTMISPAASMTVDSGDTLKTRRTNWVKSLNFFLPSSVTASGTATFKLVSLANAGPGAVSISCDSCINTTTVTFLNEPALVVRAIGLTYTFSSPPQTAAPSAIDYALLKSWLTRAYPVSTVTFSQTTASSTNTWPFTCDLADAQLATIRANDIASGTDAHTHYYGLVSNQGGYMRGCASGIPSTADPSTTASGPTGPTSGPNPEPVNVTGDTDGSFGDWYGGHELAHTYGRKHPGFCNGNSKDDTSFPYPNGQIGTDVDNGYAGLDVGDSANSIALAVLWPTSSFDIMTYCNQPQWLSAYSYEAVRQRLLDENPGFKTLVRPAAPIAMRTGEMVHVAATVNLTRSTGAIEFVTPVQRAAPQVGATERAALVVRDGAGRELSRTAVVLRETTDIPQGEDQTALIDAVVPFDPAMAQIDLVLDNNVLATYRGAATVPNPPRALRLGAVRGAEPNAPAQPTLTWTPPMAAAGNVTYTVQISNDGKAWSTIAVGLKEPSLMLTAEQARARLARVIATTGFRSAAPLTMRLSR